LQRTATPSDQMSLGDMLHPPDYRPPVLHVVLVATELLGRVQPLGLTPAWVALAAVACWPWDHLRIPVAALSLLFAALDGMGLALLPRLERSFGPVTPSLLALTLVRTGITFLSGLLWPTLPGLVGVVFAQIAIAAVSVYATWVEPFALRITRAALVSPKLDADASVRLLHISDMHVERWTRREERLLAVVEELDPDLIVMTGDYLNLSYIRDGDAHQHARQVLNGICERSSCPIYAITGSPPVDLRDVVPDVFEGLGVNWLLNDVIELTLRDQTIRLAGLTCARDRARDVPRLRRLLARAVEPGVFTLLLYHSPDLMPEAVELGIDLYLCGHTHGGQVRLPLIGALVTSSAFGKRYEMGRYEEKETTLYVSRGLGMEGLGAPRARLLSPPEVILWTLSGQGKGD